jgi:hypothetical protein
MKFIVLLAPNNKHQTLQPYIDKVKILFNNSEIPKFLEFSLD